MLVKPFADVSVLTVLPVTNHPPDAVVIVDKLFELAACAAAVHKVASAQV